MSNLAELYEYMQGKGAAKAAVLLAQADNYMQMRSKLPDEFVLPKEHERLKPVIEAFTSDLDGFVVYIRGIRDGLGRGHEAFQDVHALYRLIQTRLVQQQRRARINRALAKAIEKYGVPDFPTRQRWTAKLEHEWAKRRLKYMDAVRRGLGAKRLSSEQRAAAADEFWADIDAEIEAGERIPKWG